MVCEVSKTAQRRNGDGSKVTFITAPYRQLSVTESVTLPPELRRSIMPSLAVLVDPSRVAIQRPIPVPNV
jgi:hypothetical protein